MLNLPGTSQDWDTFANKDSKERPPRGEMSLESWHNNFHLLVGSGRSVAGNMSYTEVAAVCDVIRPCMAKANDLFSV